MLFGDLALLQTSLPNLRGVEILRGGGHWVQQEKAREVNEMIIQFLTTETPPDTRRASPSTHHPKTHMRKEQTQ